MVRSEGESLQGPQGQDTSQRAVGVLRPSLGLWWVPSSHSQHQ